MDIHSMVCWNSRSVCCLWLGAHDAKLSIPCCPMTSSVIGAYRHGQTLTLGRSYLTMLFKIKFMKTYVMYINLTMKCKGVDLDIV